MHFQFLDALSAHLESLYHTQAPVAADICPANFQGDVTVSCFPLAKALHQNPMALAGIVTDFLKTHPDVVSVESVKAFVNVTLAPAALMRDTVADQEGIRRDSLLPEEERRTILIEFSAPNTNKPQHLGHVRNNSVGMATASILERAGHKVIRVNLVNDLVRHILCLL